MFLRVWGQGGGFVWGGWIVVCVFILRLEGLDLKGLAVSMGLLSGGFSPPPYPFEQGERPPYNRL